MIIYFIYILFTYLFIFINIFIFIYVYFCFIIHLIIFHWRCVSDCWIASPQSPKSFLILTISLSFCFSGDLSNNHFQIKSAFFKNEDSLAWLNTDKVNHPFFGFVVWWPIFFYRVIFSHVILKIPVRHRPVIQSCLDSGAVILTEMCCVGDSVWRSSLLSGVGASLSVQEKLRFPMCSSSSCQQLCLEITLE